VGWHPLQVGHVHAATGRKKPSR
jgi:hypothetical protein